MAGRGRPTWYSTSPARLKVVSRTCVIMAPREGYAEARRILRKHFGQPYVIVATTAHMSKEERRKQHKYSNETKKPAKDGCQQFKAESIGERKDYVKENSFCFGSLRQGHLSKDCTKRHTCKVCGKQHPSSLHEWQPEASQENKTDQTATISHKLHFGKTTNVIPIKGDLNVCAARHTE